MTRCTRWQSFRPDSGFNPQRVAAQLVRQFVGVRVGQARLSNANGSIPRDVSDRRWRRSIQMSDRCRDSRMGGGNLPGPLTTRHVEVLMPTCHVTVRGADRKAMADVGVHPWRAARIQGE
jgi:hypothetical protein